MEAGGSLNSWRKDKEVLFLCILRASRDILIFTAISDTFQSKEPFRMLFAAVTESLASASRADLRFLKRTVIGDTKKWKCAHNYPKCEGKARQGLKNTSKSMEKVWCTMRSWIKKAITKIWCHLRTCLHPGRNYRFPLLTNFSSFLDNQDSLLRQA